MTQGGPWLAKQTGLVDGRGRPVRGLPLPWSPVDRARCGGRVAWRLLGTRIIDRARAIVRTRDHLSQQRDCAGSGWCCPTTRNRSESTRGPWHPRSGGDPRRRRYRDMLTYVEDPPGRLHLEAAGCAARSAPRRTDWPTSTTRTCAVRLVPLSPRRRLERALEILGDDVPSTSRPRGRLRIDHRQASSRASAPWRSHP